MPPVIGGTQANSLPGLARKLCLDEATFMQTLNDYNAACREGTFDHTALDDCHTEGVTPAKTHWARPLDTAPYYAYARRPGVTFHYLGLTTDETTAVRFKAQPTPNLFAPGENKAVQRSGHGHTRRGRRERAA